MFSTLANQLIHLTELYTDIVEDCGSMEKLESQVVLQYEIMGDIIRKFINTHGPKDGTHPAKQSNWESIMVMNLIY